jgi:hypothetical protein
MLARLARPRQPKRDLGFRAFWTASAAPVIAAAAASPAPTRFAVFFIWATLRLRCAFLTAAETDLLVAVARLDAARLAFVATRPAFVAAFSSLVFIRTSGSVACGCA